MKKVPLVFAFILTAMPFSSQAHAQNYPWCAQYTGSGLGGAMNCGFVSFAQCMATVTGLGGFCVVNTLYQAPSGPHRKRSG